METRVYGWRTSAGMPEELDLAQYLAGNQEYSLVWVDIGGRDGDQQRPLMEDTFGLPPLALDDALRTRHPPKYEHLSQGWEFLLLRGLDADTTGLQFGTIQLSMFWKPGLLVTRHDGPSVSVNFVRDSVADGTREPVDAPDLVWILVKTLYSRYFPLVQNLEARLEEIEDELMDNPQDTLLKELMEYSRQLKKLRRVANYHEALCRRLITASEGVTGLAPEQATDLLENSERFASLCTLMYEITSDMMEGYLSISSHKLNQVMKVLTVVTVIFVPLSFLAGLYGMNFTYIPELQWQYAYFTLLGVMATIATGLIIAFRRKGWL